MFITIIKMERITKNNAFNSKTQNKNLNVIPKNCDRSHTLKTVTSSNIAFFFGDFVRNTARICHRKFH